MKGGLDLEGKKKSNFNHKWYTILNNKTKDYFQQTVKKKNQNQILELHFFCICYFFFPFFDFDFFFFFFDSEV